MKEFEAFEPSFWEEDGLLVAFMPPTFGAFGKRTAALFASVAVSLASFGVAQEMTVQLGAHGVANAVPVEREPFEQARTADPDAVPPGYWGTVRYVLDSLPRLPAEPDEPDGEPLI